MSETIYCRHRRTITMGFKVKELKYSAAFAGADAYHLYSYIPRIEDIWKIPRGTITRPTVGRNFMPSAASVVGLHQI